MPRKSIMAHEPTNLRYNGSNVAMCASPSVGLSGEIDTFNILADGSKPIEHAGVLLSSFARLIRRAAM